MYSYNNLSNKKCACTNLTTVVKPNNLIAFGILVGGLEVLKRSQKFRTELMGDKVVSMAFEHFRRFRCRKRLNYCSRAKINNFTAPNYVDDYVISVL